jgi:pimeloyl-ACP methyl ester carboxylesterase
MATLQVGDVHIGYDRQGSGEPLILVMGLGTPRIGWFHQFTFFSQHYDVVSFDNRGVGETVCPTSFTMQDMAADVLGIADAFAFDTFHLVGISMGGMISQELALTHPERIRTLTLMATSPGGPESEAMKPEYAAALGITDPSERLRRVTELTFGARFRRENPEMMKLILDALASGRTGVDPLGGAGGMGFLTQAGAVMAWMAAGGAAARLKEIDLPTLVLHGGDDLLLPVANGRILARDIPGARYREFPDAGHAMNAEYPAEVNNEVLSHLQGTSRSQAHGGQDVRV